MPHFEPPDSPESSLFFVADDSRRRVLLGAPTRDWYAYATGYKIAADVLVRVLSTETTLGEYSCFPVLFLYRHHIELQLKALLHDFGELSEAPERVSQKHPLRPLWDRFRQNLVVHGLSHGADWLDRLQSWIDDFDALDSGSFAFRYPIDTKGRPSLPLGQAVDIEHVQAIVAEISRTLNGAAAILDEYLDVARDALEGGTYNA